MSHPPQLTLAISRCLLGEPVRYDGRDKRQRRLLSRLEGHVRWLPVCPEVEIGLGVPREPIQLVGLGARQRLVGVASGTDHSQAMDRYATDTVRWLLRQRIAGYVFKADSPSCGLSVPSFGPPPRPGHPGPVLGRTPGRFAQAVRYHAPELPVAEEQELIEKAGLRSFIGRALRHAGWQGAHPLLQRLGG